jgi:hypothetical protein
MSYLRYLCLFVGVIMSYLRYLCLFVGVFMSYLRYLCLFVGVFMTYLRCLCFFGSSLPPVVCRSAHVLLTLFVFVYV